MKSKTKRRIFWGIMFGALYICTLIMWNTSNAFDFTPAKLLAFEIGTFFLVAYGYYLVYVMQDIQ